MMDVPNGPGHDVWNAFHMPLGREMLPRKGNVTVCQWEVTKGVTC